MRRSDLLALAERVRNAPKPNRELDARIYCAFHGFTFSRPYGNDFAMLVNGVPHEVKIVDRHLERYSGSLDAALKLFVVKPETISTNPRKAAAAALLALAEDTHD